MSLWLIGLLLIEAWPVALVVFLVVSDLRAREGLTDWL